MTRIFSFRDELFYLPNKNRHLGRYQGGGEDERKERRPLTGVPRQWPVLEWIRNAKSRKGQRNPPHSPLAKREFIAFDLGARAINTGPAFGAGITTRSISPELVDHIKDWRKRCPPQEKPLFASFLLADKKEGVWRDATRRPFTPPQPPKRAATSADHSKPSRHPPETAARPSLPIEKG